MNFFNKLFNRNKNKPVDSSIGLEPEQIMQSEYIQDILKKHKKKATLLRPHKSIIPLDYTVSKFGGEPNLHGFIGYPFCITCNTPLNFVLQLYKKDFPQHYFPGDTNLFQLFRCPNGDCPDAYSSPYYSDHKMFVYYFCDNNSVNNYFIKEIALSENCEDEVPDCELRPIAIDDYPNYDDYDEQDTNEIVKRYGDNLFDAFINNYIANSGTKILGYPSFTQPPEYPVCKCGKKKEFFFQLSSEDIEDGVPFPPPPDKWSSHGIMIGDVGNIYFYVCKDCGPDTIESNWDCS